MIRTINFEEEIFGRTQTSNIFISENFDSETELQTYFGNKELVDDTIFRFSDELF